MTLPAVVGRAALTLLLFLGAAAASAQTPPATTATPPAPAQKPESVYDRIWKFAEWYRNDKNPSVQRVLFTGRFHQDFATVDADQGDAREANLRRLRLGPRITLFRTFLVHAEVELNPQERNPTYVRLTDAYVQWTKNPQVVLTAGKQAMPFTQEGATSSRELLTIDRSNIGNNIWFPQEYLPGVSLSGRRGLWNYRGGVYSTGASNREFGELNASVATLGVVGYDLSKRLGAREALLTGNYVYQDADATHGARFSRDLAHIGSVNFRFEAGRWGVRADLSAAKGMLAQPDLASVMAMPFFNITPQLQAVARYTHIGSDGPNGIRLTTYENRVVVDRNRGDEFNELYAGANYYFYGHRLKLQSGVQIGDMNDSAADGGAFSGVSWTTGLRVGW